jgi:prolyl 4-hydroxylase
MNGGEVTVQGHRNENFIRAYNAFSVNECNEIINFFETLDSSKKGEGSTLGGVNKNAKDSIDCSIRPNENELIDTYVDNLWNKAVVPYSWEFASSLLESSEMWGITEGINIQKYPPGGGFKAYHFESSLSRTSNRVMVFMTYLNDCDGGTRWLYQGVDLQPKAGLTVIWPAGFTHLHKGLVDLNKTKYIITGWIGYK